MSATRAALEANPGGTPATEPTKPTATPTVAAASLRGWVVLDDWRPSEDELADRQERAWEAADEVHARWHAALRAVPHLSPRSARALRLRLLTVVSWLPAPERDALRAYLTTGLPLEVLAALLRMPEHVFCELLLAATETLLGPAGEENRPKRLTAILTRAARRLDRPVPKALLNREAAPRRPAVRRPQLPTKPAGISDAPSHPSARQGRPGRSPQEMPSPTVLRTAVKPPAAALAPAQRPRPQQDGDQPYGVGRRAHA